MRSRVLWLAASAFVAGAAAQESEKVTLSEAIQLALSRHPEIGKAQAASDVLKGKIREVRAQALPDIAITGGALRMRDPAF